MSVDLHARHLGRLVTLHEEGRSAGHSGRTEEIMRTLLAALRETEELPDRAKLWPLAMLPHDVGKLAVPAEILRKPGPLSPYERGLIVLHAVEGREQLSWLADRAAASGSHGAAYFWRLAATIAGGHHERLDGQGYPRGLAGGALPLVLRAARTVDVYEALTARRSYREGLQHEDAIRVMRFEEGGFDERVLTALDEAMARMRVSAD